MNGEPANAEAAKGEPDTTPGARILQLSWAGTAALVVTSVLAVLFPAARAVAAIIALLLFAGGVVAFGVAFFAAVRRTDDEIGIGGLFFLQGTAPKPVQRQLMASLAIEVIVAFAAAGVRPFTTLAFGILVPMWGLALAGVWGARHGTFGPRVISEARRSRTAPSPRKEVPPSDAD
jgi:hypothetical protein